ncbi:MAG: ABC transporter permease, partial [Bacteroidota bacterium]
MTQYYISMAFRNLRKRPGFYAVNIAGLAIGLAACLMITHYVRFHNSYDTYQPDSERVYRICYSRWGEGGDNKVEFASATPVIGRLLKENFPEIEKQGQAFRLEGIYSYEDRFFEEKRAFQAESDLLDLLGVNIIEGRKINILDEPATMVMSRSAAGKYFGDESPIGKTIYHNRNTLYEVVAVFEDLPANTHFKADMFLSLETWKQQNPNLFQNGYIFSGFFNYIKLAEGVDAGLMNEKITEFVNQTYAEAFEAGQFTMGFKLQPLQSIHLNSHFMHELELNGNAASIQYLEIVAWFILVIAWVNFFNLSTIASIRRLREISIRKVNGAQRRNLIQQFLIESAVINGFAIMMALVIYELASPVFYNFADLPPGLSAWKQPWFYTLVAIAFVAGTFSAGIYSVSDIRTSRLVEYLKGVSLGIKGKRTTRKMLVGLQF